MLTFAHDTKRRLTSLALAAFVAAALVACDSGAAATSTVIPATATAPAATPTTPASPTSQPSATPLIITATSQPSPTTPPTATAIPATATAIPATATQAATPTSLATVTIAPTATTAPTIAPTDTIAPPTNTPKPVATATRPRPTATPQPPTETPLPPTETSAPADTDTSTPAAAPTDTTEPVASSTAEVTGTTTPETSGTSAPVASDTVQPTGTAAAATTSTTSSSLIVQVKPGKHMVALTFDAGAGRGRVADILDTLAKANVHITFFLTGQWAEQNPDMVKAIRDGGHEIANHSYDHPYFTKLTDAQMIDEIQHTEQIIQNIAGVSSKPYFREPFGDYNKHVLQVVASQGFQSIYWTLDSLDSVGQPKTKDFILKRVTENNIQMDGAIILQHMAADASADALPVEIERLEAKGLKIVTLSELLK